MDNVAEQFGVGDGGLSDFRDFPISIFAIAAWEALCTKFLSSNGTAILAAANFQH